MVTKEVRVGILISLFILAAITFTLWISGNPFQSKKTLRVLFDNVHGLNVGSKVEYSGLVCGKVTSFSVTPEGVISKILIEHPEVKVYQSDKFIIIPSSTIASEYQIYIVPGPQPSKVVSDSTTIIGQSTPGLQDFLFAAEDTLGDLRVTISQIQGILNKLDRYVGTVEPIFDKVSEIGRNGTLERITNDISESTRSFRQLSANANNLLNSNSQTIATTLADASSIATSVRKNLAVIEPEDLRSTVSNIKATSQNLKKLTGAVTEEQLRDGLLRVTDAADQAKEIMAKLSSDDPCQDAASILKVTLKRAERLSGGLENSLRGRSVLGVLLNRVSLNTPEEKDELKCKLPQGLQGSNNSATNNSLAP